VLGTAQQPEAAPPAQLDELEQQIKGLDAQEQELRGELRQLQGKITGYAVSTGRGISPLLGVQNSPLGGVGDQPLM
jgi:hypothetical protein